MRRIALTIALLAAGIAGLASSAGADDTRTYEIEMYNAFGIVSGSDVRIAGVNAGSVTDLDINAAKRALVTVELSGDLGTLGEDTRCSSEPQSLIAEYFINCEPSGPPIEEDDDTDDPDADIPASQVEQTVQTDLVQNTLREPFKRRLQVLINEFGTALAGNPESLNEAIRLGAPALTQLQEVTEILAEQNAIIRDLNVNSDRVIGRLAERRDDVVRFVEEARDTAEISASRGAELSRNFEILDDFLFELRPVLGDLETLAREQTPLLTDLRAAAPGLNTLAVNLPAFNRASEDSLDALGGAATVGDKALRRGRDEISQLRDTARNAYPTAELVKDFLADLLDPRRAVEIDTRAGRETGRQSTTPGTKQTMGYTGIEGLLNYAYYQTGTINQFDQISHLLHFTLYDVESGPCSHFSSGRNEETGEPEFPAQDGGTTDSFAEANLCTAWLGPNQPGVTEPLDLPPYDPSVCPEGTEPAAAEALCDSGGAGHARASAGRASAEGGDGGGAGGGGGGGDEVVPGVGGDSDGGGGSNGGGGGSGGPLPDDVIDDILDDALDDLPGGLGEGLGGPGAGAGTGQSGGGLGGGTGAAAEELLDFMFAN
jgi:ABC-type transporter Mla subunit MlaD